MSGYGQPPYYSGLDLGTGMRPPLTTRKFRRNFRCYSGAFLEGSPSLENGDKVILHASVLREVQHSLGEGPLIFSLVGPDRERRTHVGVLEFSSPRPDAAYLPRWVMNNLSVVDGAQVSFQLVKNIPRAKFIKFRPANYEFVEDNADPKSLMEHALRKFTAVTVGDTIHFTHNEKLYELEVTEVKPDTAAHAVCVIDTECEVDFETPASGKPSATFTPLKLGQEVSGTVAPKEFAYFTLPFQSEAGIVLRLQLPDAGGGASGAPSDSNATGGTTGTSAGTSGGTSAGASAGAGGAPSGSSSSVPDADIYVSPSSSKPSRSDFVWSETSIKRTKEIKVVPAHPMYPPPREMDGARVLYIGVTGYGTLPASFTLVAEPLSGDDLDSVVVGHTSGAAASGAAPTASGGGSSADPAIDPDSQACSNCRQVVPKSRIPLHEAFCIRNNWRCDQCSQVMKATEKDAHYHCQECGALIDRAEQAKHDELSHLPIECSCGLIVAPDMMSTHKQFECDMRPVPCKFCKVPIPLKSQRTHQSYCGGRTVPCEVCGAEIVMSKLATHLAIVHEVNPSLDPDSGKSASDAAFDWLKSQEGASSSSGRASGAPGSVPGAAAGAASSNDLDAEDALLAAAMRLSMDPTSDSSPVPGSSSASGSAVAVDPPSPPSSLLTEAEQNASALAYDTAMGLPPPTEKIPCPSCAALFDALEDVQEHMITTCPFASSHSSSASPAPVAPPPAPPVAPQPASSRASSSTLGSTSSRSAVSARAARLAKPSASGMGGSGAGASSTFTAAAGLEGATCPLCHTVLPSIDEIHIHMLTSCPKSAEAEADLFGGTGSPLASPLGDDEEPVYTDNDDEYRMSSPDSIASPAPAPAVTHRSGPPVFPASGRAAAPAAVSDSGLDRVRRHVDVALPRYMAPGNGSEEVGDADVTFISSASRPDLVDGSHRGSGSGGGSRRSNGSGRSSAVAPSSALPASSAAIASASSAIPFLSSHDASYLRCPGCGYIADALDLLQMHMLCDCPEKDANSAAFGDNLG